MSARTTALCSILLQEDVELEVDPDQQLERETDKEPVTVNRMGSDVQIQRMPAAEDLEEARDNLRDEDEEGVSADPEALATEVEEIKETQQALVDKVSDDDSGWTDKIGEATGKGAVGAVGGLVGAAAGSLVAPVVGSAGGAVAGQQVATELASGVAGDVAKTAYEPVYEAGKDAIAEKSASVTDYIDEKIDEKIRDRFRGSQTGDTNDATGLRS